MLLSACGGAPAASPTAVPAAATAPAAPPTAAAAAPTAAPAPPTPSFEPVTDTEPTVGATQASGTLSWRDQVLRNDAVFVSVSGLTAPEAGQVYTAWLASADSSLPLGPLQASTGGALALNYTSPTQENLLAKYDRVYVTKGTAADATTEVKNVVLTGGLPEKALVHIRHILFSIGNTPGKIGFALGLRQETDELLRHAQFLKDAFDNGDFALERAHAEHIVNIIEGSQGEHFGDLNGDGKTQNPGDGFGILQNGQQDGYAKGMSDHAKLGADAPDATDAIKLHAGHVQITGENVRVRVTDIRDRALKISKAGGIADTQQDVLNILALAQQTIQGVDVNQDEQVGPIPGEGGVVTAYQHAQLMAGIALAPGTAPTAPAAVEAPPAAAPQTFNIEIGDNTFTPNKISIPVGATVVWTDKGQHPHTVTADDASFDSQELHNGDTFKQTFDTAGTFPFFCKFHGGKGAEGMSGSIVVVAPAATAPAPAAAQPTVAPTGNATTVQVAIGDNTFTPKQINVPVGGTVVWTHGGQRQHTVTADDGSFKSDTLKNGDTFKQTFNTAGTFAYYCEFHGGPGGAAMSGVIVVGGSDTPPAAPTAAPTTAPPAPTAAPPAAAATVSMKDFEFAPKEIRVKVGTTITWKNEGTKPHSATAVDKSFDTTIFQPGESKSVTFSTAGTFAYFCQLHGSPDGKSAMVGTVVVEQ
jgi:plastocyanin